MSLRDIAVIVRVPDEFSPRASWVLNTMLAQLGCRGMPTGELSGARNACLAYASQPVPGVPTIPCSPVAMELFKDRRALPSASYTPRPEHAQVAGAFPVVANGFAVGFDLVASAFALLACWDEYTSDERDQYGRLPYTGSLFGANPELDIANPAVDRYVELLRDIVGQRLGELGEPALPPPGWMWATGEADAWSGRRSFAVALTHDLDNLWRWTPRGFAAAAYRGARALRHRNMAALRREAGDVGDWLLRHAPRRTDPYWTFAQMLGGEDARGVDSTFFVIARHTHPRDGNQPRTYRKRLPAALALLREHRREVGLHGNDSDRLSLAALRMDRASARAGSDDLVRGMRYHYLRCLYHETLPLLDEAGFEYDTSLAFAEREGYRCGCSFPFHPYSLRDERPLDLVELPLAVMDGTLQQSHYRGLPAAEAERAARVVLQRALLSGGSVSLLWHNNRFDPRTAQGYDDVYWRVLDWLLAEGGWATSAGAIVARWRNATAEPRPDSTCSGTSPTPHRPSRRLARDSAGSALRAGRLRVLHVSVVHRPDDPRIYERECRSLASAGWKVAYLCPGAEGGPDSYGVLRVALPIRSRRTRFLDTREIVLTIRRLRPQVVHVHDPELLTLFPLLRKSVLRLVYDMHEYVPEAVAGKPYIPAVVRPFAAAVTGVAQKSLAALADGVVVVTAEQLPALGGGSPLRLVLPNYPRLDRFDGAAPVGELAEDPRLKLIYVGSLSRARGCTMMLDVVERLASDDVLLCLGGTFNEPSLEIEVRARLAAGLSDRVRILGRIPPADLPGYLAATDVVWVPSLPDRQYGHPTIPTKLLEGMTMRKAILVSDMPGRGDLVRREGCGLAVPPGVEGHLDGVRRLLAQRDALPAMGERGRAAVERDYSWEAVAGDLVDFYGSLCEALDGGERS